MLIPAKARAYVNHGRWVADCPAECGGAMSLDPRQGLFACGVCKQMNEVEWPDNPDEIFETLMRRPLARNRNWFPTGHFLALRGSMAHGQTVNELLEEEERYGVDGSPDSGHR
jgi:hypothetical protein